MKIFSLAFSFIIALILPTTSVTAEESVKDLIFDNCNGAIGKLSTLSPVEEAEMLEYLTRILTLNTKVPDSVASFWVQPGLPRSSDTVPGALWQAVDAKRELDAKMCALEVIEITAKDGEKILPKLVSIYSTENLGDEIAVGIEEAAYEIAEQISLSGRTLEQSSIDEIALQLFSQRPFLAGNILQEFKEDSLPRVLLATSRVPSEQAIATFPLIRDLENSTAAIHNSLKKISPLLTAEQINLLSKIAPSPSKQQIELATTTSSTSKPSATATSNNLTKTRTLSELRKALQADSTDSVSSRLLLLNEIISDGIGSKAATEKEVLDFVSIVSREGALNCEDVPTLLSGIKAVLTSSVQSKSALRIGIEPAIIKVVGCIFSLNKEVALGLLTQFAICYPAAVSLELKNVFLQNITLSGSEAENFAFLFHGMVSARTKEPLLSSENSRQIIGKIFERGSRDLKFQISNQMIASISDGVAFKEKLPPEASTLFPAQIKAAKGDKELQNAIFAILARSEFGSFDWTPYVRESIELLGTDPDAIVDVEGLLLIPKSAVLNQLEVGLKSGYPPIVIGAIRLIRELRLNSPELLNTLRKLVRDRSPSVASAATLTLLTLSTSNSDEETANLVEALRRLLVSRFFQSVSASSHTMANPADVKGKLSAVTDNLSTMQEVFDRLSKMPLGRLRRDHLTELHARLNVAVPTKTEQPSLSVRQAQ